MRVIFLSSVWILMLIELQYFTSAKDSLFSLNPFLEIYAPLSTNYSQCYADSLNFKNAAKQLTPWALQMLDASSKIPSSLMLGNTVDLGNFDQCLAVRSDGADASRNVIGKYCLIKATFNQTSEEVTVGDLAKEWSWAVCMPATCTSSDLIRHLKHSFKEDSFVPDHIQKIYCRSSINDTGLPITSWIFIIFTLFLLAFIFVATFIEHRSIKMSQIVQSAVLPFSLMRNGKMLLNTAASGKIDSMHGIRTISMLAVVAFHRAACVREEYNVNRVLVPELLSYNLIGALIQNTGYIAVDSFFLMSGIVLARNFMAGRKAQVQFSYIKYVLRRFFRITPPYLFVILLHITVLYDLGSGPVWEDILGSFKRNCAENWWLNILYINNYVKSVPGVMCMDHTWYLGADMQFYIMAPAFLYIIHKNHKLGITLILGTCLSSCLYAFYASYGEGYPWIPIKRDTAAKANEYFTKFHVRDETRAPPYLLGLLLGYFLERFKKEKIIMPQLTLAVGWTVSASILFTFPYLRTIGHLCGWGAFGYSFFEASHRALFGAAVGWVVFACDQGYGGPVNRFLSHPCFQILSRLSFCIYLTHFMAMYYDLGTKRTIGYFSYYSLFQRLLSDIVVVIIGSAILSLMLEYPFIHLNKWMFKNKKKEDKSQV